eukprot:PhM_4_TR3016/c1_g1_i2/m.89347
MSSNRFSVLNSSNKKPKAAVKQQLQKQAPAAGANQSKVLSTKVSPPPNAIDKKTQQREKQSNRHDVPCHDVPPAVAAEISDVFHMSSKPLVRAALILSGVCSSDDDDDDAFFRVNAVGLLQSVFIAVVQPAGPQQRRAATSANTARHRARQLRRGYRRAPP